MAVAWPVFLPQTPRDGTSVSPDVSTIRSPTDHGPVQTRREFTAVSERWSLPFRFTEVELRIFWNFYTNTILDGAEKFDMPHPYGAGAPYTEVRFREVPAPRVIGNGAGEAIWECNIIVETVLSGP